MIPLLALVILFIILHNASRNQGEEVSILGFKTRYFHVSNGASKRVFENMKSDKMPPESLKEFLMMEDLFLRTEHLAVCSGVSHRNDGYTLSDKIKETFVGYDFRYHVAHLKQISEPHKLINRNIRC